MPLYTLVPILEDAGKYGYAVPEFNTDCIEITQAILEVCEEEKSPVVIGVGQGAVEDGKLMPIAAMVKRYAAGSILPIVLHLDHSRSFPQIMNALREGFSSIMIDGSALPLQENIGTTKKIIDICSCIGVSVEAEVGRIFGVEDGIVTGDGKDAFIFDDFSAFISAVTPAALAVPVGSVHGMTTVEPRIDVDLLREMKKKTEIPLVLHGGSGLSKDQVQAAISHGINKVNFGTEIRLAFLEGVEKGLGEKKNIYAVFESGRERVRTTIRDKIGMCMSGGRG
jgi:fructose-bisphosphate aldolase class II